MRGELWAAEATPDGISIVRYSAQGESEPVQRISEDVQGLRRLDVGLWLPLEGTVVVRLPAPTERPFAMSTDGGGTFRYCAPVPGAERSSAERGRAHAGGRLTFFTSSFVLDERVATVWVSHVEATDWEPVVCPLGFVAWDVAADDEGLWVGGEWRTTGEPGVGRGSILRVSYEGDVLAEVVPSFRKAGWFRRRVVRADYIIEVNHSPQGFVCRDPGARDITDTHELAWSNVAGEWRAGLVDSRAAASEIRDGVVRLVLWNGRAVTSADGRTYRMRSDVAVALGVSQVAVPTATFAPWGEAALGVRCNDPGERRSVVAVLDAAMSELTVVGSSNAADREAMAVAWAPAA